MNSLKQPSGWIDTSVGVIFDIKGGGTPPTENPAFWEGPILWITSADIHGLKDIKPRKKITLDAIEKSATHCVPKGSIIVVTRVGLGKIALASTDLCFSQDCQALIGNWNNLVPEYCLYYLSCAVQIFKYKNRGTTISGVTVKQLRELEFPLPPLPEQHRIVTKIEELFTQLDAGVALLKKVQAQLKRYRQAILKAAFEGRLTQEWREKYKGEIEPADVLVEKIWNESNSKVKSKDDRHVLNNDIDRPSLPNGWIWTTFSSVGIWSGGGTPSTSIDKYWGGGILWISSKDVKVLKIFNSELKITPLGVTNSAAKMIPAGSLLFVVRSGILQRTLPVALNMVDTTVNQDIKVLIPSKKINNEFLLWIAVAFGDNIRHTCAKDGTTVQSINVPALRDFLIPLAPKHEQNEIVAQIERHMSIADKIENIITTSIRQAETLRQSILKQAFEGKLVPQDPNDEPASILLERIKAEKSRHAAEVKKGKTLQPKSPKRKIQNAN